MLGVIVCLQNRCIKEIKYEYHTTKSTAEIMGKSLTGARVCFKQDLLKEMMRFSTRNKEVISACLLYSQDLLWVCQEAN